MEFGLGALLEKIEEHFGIWALRAILLLVALAVGLVCGKLIWEIALGPIVVALTGVTPKSALLSLAWLVFAGVASAIITFLIIGKVYGFKYITASRKLHNEIGTMHDEAEAALAEARAILDAVKVEAGDPPKPKRRRKQA